MDSLTRYDDFGTQNIIANQIGPDNNQLTSSAETEPGGLTIYGYDNMGNLEMEVNPQTETMDQIHWTADGKLAVTMKNVLVKDSITHEEHILNLYQHYYYDGMGNRVLKVGNGKLDPTGPGVDPIVIHCNEDIGTSPCTTCQEDLNVRGYYYGREAGGKVLATYETSPEGITGMGTGCYDAYYYQNLKEWYIYGSESDGRIAVQRPYPNEFTDNLRINALHLYDQAEPYAMKDTIIEYQANTIGSYTSNARFKGYKQYEIKDHLGNVRAVISDVKNPLSMYGSIDNWTFRAEIRNLNNYYPYGLQIPTGAYASIGNYTYGYNGMEKDDELKGSGKLYSTLFREGDTENGRWWSRDPLEMSMPYHSPYQMMDGNPIQLTDVLGLSTNVTSNEDGTYNVVGGNLEDDDKSIYVIDKDGKRTEKIGESLTIFSFYNEDEQDGEEQTGWKGTIDPNSTESQDLVSSFVTEADKISLLYYMFNATNGKDYDFKRDGDEDNDDRNFHHRGSLWETKEDGTKIFATARDAGNFAAGYIAGIKNLTWDWTRIGFDLFEIGKSAVSGDFVKGEGRQSTLAQRLGFHKGYPIGHARWIVRHAKWIERMIERSKKLPIGPKY